MRLASYFLTPRILPLGMCAPNNRWDLKVTVWLRATISFSTWKGVWVPSATKLPLSTEVRLFCSPVIQLPKNWMCRAHKRLFPARKAKIHKMTSTSLFSWRQSKRSVGRLKCQRPTWQNILKMLPNKGQMFPFSRFGEARLMMKGSVASFHPSGT